MAGLGDSLLVCPLGLCRDGTFPPFHLRGKGDSSLLRPVWGPEGCQGSGCSRHRVAGGGTRAVLGEVRPLWGQQEPPLKLHVVGFLKRIQTGFEKW